MRFARVNALQKAVVLLKSLAIPLRNTDRLCSGLDQRSGHRGAGSRAQSSGCERIFREKASGGRRDRPELHRLLDQLRKGDVLVVWKLDRLSRSLRDVLIIMERLAEAKAGFSLRRMLCDRKDIHMCVVPDAEWIPYSKATKRRSSPQSRFPEMYIRHEAVYDQPGIHEVHVLAFHGPAEAKLVDDLRQSGDVVISLVATDGDRILGHILLSKLRAPMRALALAPVGVHPDFQRQGIGSALIHRGLERARADGWEAVFVLGDTAYYSRFGFSVEAAEGYISRYSSEHFMMLPLDPRNVPITGELVYPAPFKLLD